MKKLILPVVCILMSVACLSSTKVAPPPQANPKPTAAVTAPTELPTTEAPTAVKESPTDTPEPTEEPTAMPTDTEEPTEEPTANPVDEVRQRVNDFGNDEMIGLMDDFSDAEFYNIKDFELTGNQTTHLFHQSYDLYPSDFLAIADVEYDNGSNSIRASSTGCGYMFNDFDEEKMYFVLFTLDNEVRLTYVRNGYWDGIKHVKDMSLDFPSPSGTAQIMLVVEGDHITFAVNGKVMIDQTVQMQNGGAFGYSLLSGTNAGFGTSCRYKNSVVLVNK
jgi:hypothetical protein